MDDRFALGDLARLSVNRDEHRLVERSDEKRRQIFSGRPRGLPDWPFLKRVCTGGLRSFAAYWYFLSDILPPLRRQRWVSITGLPRRSFAPISELPHVVNIAIRLVAKTIFESDEPTPSFPPLLSP
jgi:hypothetical protein